MRSWSSFSDIKDDTFFSYLRSQRRLISGALAFSILLFLLLKYAFPYPDLFVDSSNYVTWAAHNFTVAYRPLGYAHFLQAVHFVIPSAFFTVLVQYAGFVCSTLFLLLSADYLFGLRTKLKLPILLALLCNPLLIFEANLISSDSWFCSLSVAWFTTCLWLLKKPGWLILALQLLFLYLCFQVRYTAMLYPLIAVASFLLCPAKMIYRLTGITLVAAVILFSIEQQMAINEKETGTRVFSGFSGWQAANNALYCYKHIDMKTEDLPDEQTRIIDQCTKIYIDSVTRTGSIGAAYLWDPHSPLKKYLNICAHRDHSDYLIAWFTASKPLGDYGRYIITHYPKTFTQYFLLPNTANFFYPGLEVLANYDYSNMVLLPDVKQWFGFQADHLDCIYPFLQERLMYLCPATILAINMFSILSLIYFIFKKDKINPGTRRLLIIWCLFYLGYMLFSILASVIFIRYISILSVVCIVMPFVFLKQKEITDKANGDM